MKKRKMTLKQLQIDKTWTLFLDRDGVINHRIVGDYVKKKEEFIFLPGVLEAITKFSTLFGAIFVVTNQQGIGKKTMTESNLSEIHDYMHSEIQKAGGKLTKVYYAPNMASEESQMRKPNPGMGLLAKAEFSFVDFEKSLMVGDSNSDIHFGTNLGMKTVKIGERSVEADFYMNSLIELANQL